MNDKNWFSVTGLKVAMIVFLLAVYAWFLINEGQSTEYFMFFTISVIVTAIIMILKTPWWLDLIIILAINGLAIYCSYFPKQFPQLSMMIGWETVIGCAIYHGLCQMIAAIFDRKHTRFAIQYLLVFCVMGTGLGIIATFEPGNCLWAQLPWYFHVLSIVLVGSLYQNHFADHYHWLLELASAIFIYLGLGVIVIAIQEIGPIVALMIVVQMLLMSLGVSQLSQTCVKQIQKLRQPKA